MYTRSHFQLWGCLIWDIALSCAFLQREALSPLMIPIRQAALIEMKINWIDTNSRVKMTH